jgi:hypothetical protein
LFSPEFQHKQKKHRKIPRPNPNPNPNPKPNHDPNRNPNTAVVLSSKQKSKKGRAPRNSDVMGDSSDREKSVPKSNSEPSTVKGKKRVVVAMGLNSDATVNSSVRVESLPKPNSSKPRTAKGKKSLVIAKGLGKKRQFTVGTVNVRSMAHCGQGREDELPLKAGGKRLISNCSND